MFHSFITRLFQFLFSDLFFFFDSMYSILLLKECRLILFSSLMPKLTTLSFKIGDSGSAFVLYVVFLIFSIFFEFQKYFWMESCFSNVNAWLSSMTFLICYIELPVFNFVFLTSTWDFASLAFAEAYFSALSLFKFLINYLRESSEMQSESSIWSQL